MRGEVLLYPVELLGDGHGALYARFPDVPEAMTFAPTEKELLDRAALSLRAALDNYVLAGLELPRPSPPSGRRVMAVPRDEIWRRGIPTLGRTG